MKKSPYTPDPIDTSKIILPEEIRFLIEQLAENTHKIWAQQRIKEGWKYGPSRNEKTKEHPCLVVYEDLPEHEKEYDRNTAVETLKVLISLGYRITK